jgi:8-amino-7-oxononanoate synthase
MSPARKAPALVAGEDALGDGQRSIFSGIESIVRRRRRVLDAFGTNPLETRVERILSPTEAVIAGRPVRLFGTNNYLGLTFDREMQQAAIRAVREEGVGTTASRVASGNLPGHYLLEQEIAEFVHKRTAIVFSTGFQANLGTIAGLCGGGDIVLVDRDCHASIFDAVRLSGARAIRFRHNDVAHLEKLLDSLDHPKSRVLIVIESIYSALGDMTPLEEIIGLKERAGCYLLVDEAHSIGLYGARGEGLAAELGVIDSVDVLTGTFSKSFGLMGGFAASNHPDFFSLRFAARPFVFTAALPPAVVSSARVAIKKIASAHRRRERLWCNAAQLRAGLKALGLRVIAARSPIVSAIFDDIAESHRVWSRLLQAGFYVNWLIPPACPVGSCILRFSLCSEHTAEDISALLDAACSALGKGALHEPDAGDPEFHLPPPVRHLVS